MINWDKIHFFIKHDESIRPYELLSVCLYILAVETIDHVKLMPSNNSLKHVNIVPCVDLFGSWSHNYILKHAQIYFAAIISQVLSRSTMI